MRIARAAAVFCADDVVATPPPRRTKPSGFGGAGDCEPAPPLLGAAMAEVYSRTASPKRSMTGVSSARSRSIASAGFSAARHHATCSDGVSSSTGSTRMSEAPWRTRPAAKHRRISLESALPSSGDSRIRFVVSLPASTSKPMACAAARMPTLDSLKLPTDWMICIHRAEAERYCSSGHAWNVWPSRKHMRHAFGGKATRRQSEPLAPALRPCSTIASSKLRTRRSVAVVVRWITGIGDHAYRR
mmetsp:Transcript_2033/g.6360  ORF Transcript_2033/g.6360 Transcript_2033/m.6360 type:complete len:244 (+) Transcript_2033:940-1671(+)